MKTAYTLLISFLLTACAPLQEPLPLRLVKDTHGFEILMGQFAHHIEEQWGPYDVVIAGLKDYVKYSDHYQTRAHINFQKGVLTVETLYSGDPQGRLRRAMVQTLLMGEEACHSHLFDDQEALISRHPFLSQQILDHHHQPITTLDQAECFTHNLLKHRSKRCLSNGRASLMLTVPLVSNHLNQRAQKYLRWVKQAARHYQLDESLILAIIQTESSFNPYAVSGSQALGLMQVKPESAGRDVFAHIKRRHGRPSRSYLLNPSKNIDIGAAYLHLLHTRYLGKIRHPLSRRHAVIAAYNSGTSSVLRTFAADNHSALAIINQLSPAQVYHTLVTRHPSSQARQYLHKVKQAQQYYRRHVLS
jgi:membrane-bound lytic murein transglycosylase C